MYFTYVVFPGDIISDVTREHNVSKVHVICYNLVLMLVFYCNFLHEKYLLSCNLLNVPCKSNSEKKQNTKAKPN